MSIALLDMERNLKILQHSTNKKKAYAKLPESTSFLCKLELFIFSEKSPCLSTKLLLVGLPAEVGVALFGLMLAGGEPFEIAGAVDRLEIEVFLRNKPLGVLFVLGVFSLHVCPASLPSEPPSRLSILELKLLVSLPCSVSQACLMSL